jgi:hypothetical protein
MTTDHRGKSAAQFRLECDGASSPAWSDGRAGVQPLSKPASQLEFSFLGIHAKARGALAIIVVALLVAMWMALRTLHMS